MDEEWCRDVKQMKRSLVEEVDGVRCGGGGGLSESIDWLLSLCRHCGDGGDLRQKLLPLSWCMNGGLQRDRKSVV